MKEKKNPPIIQDKWVRWVALTTTILAVCAAISSMKGSSNSTKVQIWTTKESNQWQFYQSKSIKKYLMQLQQDDFKVQYMTEGNSVKKEYYGSRMKYYDEKIKQYEEEEKGIMGEAKKLNADQDIFKKRNGQFSDAVMFLQVAIMLSSIAALLKKNILWYVGLVFGAAGIFFMVNGFTLTFSFLI